jgi:class 3 adenylate cyclase
VDIAAWLRGLGLEQYEQAFRDNAVDAAVLPELTAEDLKDLGVGLVGHRRKLLAAIAVLRSAVGPVSDAPVTASTVERRLLSVMFCDLVESTVLSSRLDPEDLREVIAAYHRAVVGVVAQLDGFVAKYMGDGVLIYFGYPRAHEDDAERAVRAGLGLIDAVRQLDVKSVKAPSARRDRHRVSRRWRSDRRRIGAGAIGRRRNPEPRRPATSPGRTRRGHHRSGHAPAGTRCLMSAVAVLL